MICGLDAEAVAEGLSHYLGAGRRMEYKGKWNDVDVYDDYAHHPNEISAAISSTRERYPDFRYTAIFQPHLYTRTRDFAPEFAQALSLADKVILLDIYPARELPIPGVTSEIIFKDVTAPEKVLLRKEELMDYMNGLELGEKEVFVTVGAGDIDRFVEPIGKLLETKILG